MGVENLGNFREIGGLRYRDNEPRHHILSLEPVALDVLARFRVGIGEYVQPPLAPLLSAHLAAMAKVGLADNAYDAVIIRNDWDGADAMMHEQGSNLTDCRFRSHRDDICCHGVLRIHGDLLRSEQSVVTIGSPLGSALISVNPCVSATVQ
jgi:hypothetical protein